MNIQDVKRITRSAIEDLGLDDYGARAMRHLASLKSAAATKIGDLVAAAAIAMCSGIMAIKTDEIAADAVRVLKSQGVPRMMIPTIFLAEERRLIEMILTSMVVESLSNIGASESTIETARDMIKVNMTAGLLEGLPLTAAVSRTVEGGGA